MECVVGYGSYPNAALLTAYEFAIEHNEYDVVILDFDMKVRNNCRSVFKQWNREGREELSAGGRYY